MSENQAPSAFNKIGKWLLAALSGLLLLLAGEYLKEIRATRFKVTVFGIEPGPRGPGSFMNGPVDVLPYTVTITNVGPQTLFSCIPHTERLGVDGKQDDTGEPILFENSPVDINSYDHHTWDETDSIDRQGRFHPVAISATCSYYDRFGFKHSVREEGEPVEGWP